MNIKSELLDPCICDTDSCPNFGIALENGFTEESAQSLCQSAMRRIIGSDPDLSLQSMTDGMPCGLYLLDQEAVDEPVA